MSEGGHGWWGVDQTLVYREDVEDDHGEDHDRERTFDQRQRILKNFDEVLCVVLRKYRCPQRPVGSKQVSEDVHRFFVRT